jgi:hypothetical protein
MTVIHVDGHKIGVSDIGTIPHKENDSAGISF